MRTGSTLLFTLALALAACASTNVSDRDPDGAPPDPDADTTPRPDARPAPTNAAVYAHSATELYKVDPDTYDVALVAAFTFDTASDAITDIAIDKDGNMVGISVDKLYAIDSDTAACTFIADLDSTFAGLTYVPAEGQTEALIAAAFDGGVFKIDPSTGNSTVAGNFGGGLESSGDLVAVKDFGIVATVEVPGGTTDRLARLDPFTFEATILGDTGYAKLFGLGFWKNEVYGFSANNEFLVLDVDDGSATVIETGTVSWWGAGVTTLAPIVN